MWHWKYKFIDLFLKKKTKIVTCCLPLPLLWQGLRVWWFSVVCSVQVAWMTITPTKATLKLQKMAWHWLFLRLYCWFQTSLPLAALPHDHRLLFQSCSSQRQHRFGSITKWHRSQVEKNSTVCDLPRWAKRQGYRLIGLTLLAARSSLCGKWRLHSWTNIVIKVAMWQAAS